jgi:hypothetical protein
VIAIGSGGRYVAWENFGSQINVVRSDELFFATASPFLSEE